MYNSLATLLLEEKEIVWDSKAMHICCMNYTINLAIQTFLKDLRVLPIRMQNHIDDENDEASDVTENEELAWEPQTVLFTVTLKKLQLITKVHS